MEQVKSSLLKLFIVLRTIYCIIHNIVSAGINLCNWVIICIFVFCVVIRHFCQICATIRYVGMSEDSNMSPLVAIIDDIFRRGLSQSGRYHVSNRTAGSVSLVILLLRCSYHRQPAWCYYNTAVVGTCAASPSSNLIGWIIKNLHPIGELNCQSNSTVRIAWGPASQCGPKFPQKFVVVLS